MKCCASSGSSGGGGGSGSGGAEGEVLYSCGEKIMYVVGCVWKEM